MRDHLPEQFRSCRISNLVTFRLDDRTETAIFRNKSIAQDKSVAYVGRLFGNFQRTTEFFGTRPYIGFKVGGQAL